MSSEKKPNLDDFKNVKSLLSSPELSKPKNLEGEPFNFKGNNDKPYLSDQAKLLLEELNKYKTVFRKQGEQSSNR